MAEKFKYKAYEDDSATKAAQNKVTQLEAQKPSSFQYADYNSKYAGMSEDLMNKYLNRDKFSYDINGDALYQQYKDQYINQGNMAMMDTMGQASAMTGGYGNSYAQTVGQQTYQGYLQQLNDKIPELYQLALDQYNREGEEMLNQYGLVTDADDRAYNRWNEGYNREYGQYRDSVADWQNQLDRADANYWNTKNFGYGMYSDDRNLAYEDFQFGQNYDQTEKWSQRDYELALKQFEEEKRQYNESLAWQKEQAKKNSSSGSNSYTYKPKGDEGDEGDDGTPPPVEGYDTVLKKANDFVANGKNMSYVSNYLRTVWKEGIINTAEYNELKGKFSVSNAGGGGGHYAY